MQVYIGIDWSEKKHDVSIQNEAGAEILRLCISHSEKGFEQLDEARQKLGMLPGDCVVGMETAHNLLIDFLWGRGYENLYVLPPAQVNSNQGRVRQSGARSDPSDANLIAELLRTDRHRWHSWHPGSPLLQQMRVKLSEITFLTKEIVRYTNRLRSILLRYYPAIVHTFSSLDTQICLIFIQTYTTPQAAAQLSLDDFQSFARQHHYPQRYTVRAYTRLQQPQPEALPATVAAFHNQASFLANLLLQLVRAKSRELHHLDQLFHQHPDQEIFDSLPAAGVLLSAGLLVKFGEDRQRFSDPHALQALAGTCPVTVQSGRRRHVHFRYACDHEFRYLVQEWARLSINHSLWATDYFERSLKDARSPNHAYRRLANRWLAIVWRIWQDHARYDETYHMKRRLERQVPRA